MGKADAEAAGDLRRAPTAGTRELYRFVRTLDHLPGHHRQGQLLVLSTDAELFRFLRSALPAGAATGSRR